MNVQKPWAFERVLTKLLHGSFHDLQQVRADLDAVGMSLEADHFFVMVVDNTEADIAGILPAAFRDPVAFAYASELLREDSLAILVGYFKKDSTHRQIQEQAAATLIDLLQERGQRNFFIGIGTVHSQLLHTNRSYIEAMGAIEYKFTQSDEVVIFFEDIRERNNLSFRVPFKEKVRFVESLRQADKQVALEALHSMFRSIERNEQSVISLKMDKRIGTIIREAGYVDASNFIRKFKQTVGMTPGQYRASHRLLQSGGISPVKAKSHP
jgi:AraC-like DNA-binding protein